MQKEEAEISKSEIELEDIFAGGIQRSPSQERVETPPMHVK